MKKVFCILMAALLLMTSASSAFAAKMFDQYWKPGEYTVEPTDAEKAYYNSLYERALKENEGTPLYGNFEAYTYENMYQSYLDFVERTHGESEHEFNFEDVTNYDYVVGMPDETAISTQQALIIAYRVVKEQYQILDSQLSSYLPFYAYFVYDSSNPVWRVKLDSYDSSLGYNITICIYAHDGSVQGVRKKTISE